MISYGPNPDPRHSLGGKAGGLYRLQAMGVAVPSFLVITAETFDPLLGQLPPGASPEACRQWLLGAVLPADDQHTLAQVLAQWQFPERAVVVRSSVGDEDGVAAAFPGLMDSFLNLTTWADVQTAIGRCIASAYSDRAVAYRSGRGLTQRPRPAVIVQQQVVPLVSGVVFTTFPEYPQELAIHATYGFGEGLVGGQFDADEFYWLKQLGHLHRRVLAHKPAQLVARTETGLQPVPVLVSDQDVYCLPDSQLADIFEVGMRLEKAFGRPQDIEFVVAQEGLFVVQSRAITQPIPDVITYDNANIQESYCGVTTPLTFSFASRAYATVYRQTMQALGLSAARIQAQEGVVINLLGLVKGRIYYNINNWYRGLQLLPSFRQNKADMERMMGLDEPVDFVQDRPKTSAEQLAMLPGLVVNLSRLLWAFSRLNRRVPAFHTQFRRVYDAFYSLPLNRLTVSELVAKKEIFDTALLGNWSTPIINDFFVMMTNGNVVRLLKKAGMANPEAFLSRYLSGDTQLESTQPVRAMHALAVTARQQPALWQLLLTLPPTTHQQVQQAYPAFYAAVARFIDQYGDRTVGELKLETITMRLDPLVCYRYLRNYLTANLLTDPLTGHTSLHTAAATELTLLLANQPFLRQRGLLRQLARLQRAIRYREQLRLERTRIFGMYRALYLGLGSHLVMKKALAAPRDVFYLTEAEIIQAVTTPYAPPLTRLVADRQREFAAYETQDVPSRVTVPSPPVAVAPPPPTTNTLWGVGCVPGLVTGEVIVITDPRDNLDVTGKIVCALRTDPGWAVLFPTCRAVLIEKGSSLSHSVILLRELGLPTIINVPGLTKRLRSGQYVHLDGTTGELTLLPHDH